jgi:GNAT superfamily N-acetyltransferase
MSRAHTQAFVGTFLRPKGLDVPCTPLLADALERAAAHPGAPVRDLVGARVLRVAVLPVAVLLRLMEFGEGSGLLSRKGLGEVWRRLGKNSRTIARFLVVRPLRAGLWIGRRIVAFLRRAARRAVYWVLTMPRRGLRLIRHVRYHVAVRLRGDGQA